MLSETLNIRKQSNPSSSQSRDMSASETRLTDSIGFVEIYDANGQPYHADLVPADDCRAIERRLNAAVDALEGLYLSLPSFAQRKIRKAIANARKNL